MHGRDACEFSIYIEGGKNVRWINFLLDNATQKDGRRDLIKRKNRYPSKK